MGLIGIDVSGLKELRELALKLPDAVFDAITEDVGDYLVNVLRSYPPQNYVTRKAAYGQTFFSDRQRRWFFASLHDGSLTLPYRRSRNLGQSWAYEVRTPTLAIIGTNVGYARLVKDEGHQSAYLAAVGWPTVQDDAAKAEPRVRAALDQAIRLAIGIR
jgi:hypothetical protein